MDSPLLVQICQPLADRHSALLNGGSVIRISEALPAYGG